MDDSLKERLNALAKQNELLSEVRNAFLLKEASRKHFEAALISGAPGKSHADRTTNAQAMPEWLHFAVELAELESRFEFEKLKYDILDKAYLAEHLTFKLDEKTIKRG